MNILNRLIKDTNALTESDTHRHQRIQELKQKYPEETLPVWKAEPKEMFINKAQQGPLHTVDVAWTKNLDYLKKEILSAEKACEVSKERLIKSQNELREAEYESQDCEKKVYALKDALVKLQSLVPEHREPAPKEPQLLTEATKKVAKKRPRRTNAK